MSVKGTLKSLGSQSCYQRENTSRILELSPLLPWSLRFNFGGEDRLFDITEVRNNWKSMEVHSVDSEPLMCALCRLPKMIVFSGSNSAILFDPKRDHPGPVAIKELPRLSAGGYGRRDPSFLGWIY